MNLGQHILFLDDLPERRREFLTKFPASTCVSTVTDCIRMLQEGQFVTLFLDFDLDQEGYVKGSDPDSPTCGMEVVRWLQKNSPGHLVEIILHSHNPLGVSAMLEGLKDSRYQVYAVRFGEGRLWSAQR